MASDEGPGEPGKERRRELTPAERAAARQAMEALRLALNARVQFQAPRYTFAESTIQAITEHQRTRINQLVQPMLDAHIRWQKQMSSDILKFTGAMEPQLKLVSERLVNSADFAFDRMAQRFAEQWATQQATWLKGLSRTFERLKVAFFPSNLQSIDGLKLAELESTVLLDGLGLYEVPRAEIAEKLLLAGSSAKRREIVGRRWEDITADCRTSLEQCQSQEMTSLVKKTLKAVEALEQGHAEASQSLLSGIADKLVVGHLTQLKHHLVPGPKNTTPAAYEELHLRQYIALAPIWQAFQSYRPADGDPVPFVFNRHASVHSVGTRQYSRRNAVQGLMLVCGILRFLDEQALAQSAA